MNFNTPDFQMAKMWISSARVADYSWDDICTGFGTQQIDDFLQRTVFWRFDLATWEQLVEYMRREEEARDSVANRHTAATIIGTDQNNSMFRWGNCQSIEHKANLSPQGMPQRQPSSSKSSSLQQHSLGHGFPDVVP